MYDMIMQISECNLYDIPSFPSFLSSYLFIEYVNNLCLMRKFLLIQICFLDPYFFLIPIPSKTLIPLKHDLYLPQQLFKHLPLVAG